MVNLAMVEDSLLHMVHVEIMKYSVENHKLNLMAGYPKLRAENAPKTAKYRGLFRYRYKYQQEPIKVVG